LPFLNEKGKFLGLVNPVDLVIVLVVAGLAAGAGYKLFSPRATAPFRPVTFEFVAQGIDPQVAALVRQGDAVISTRGPAGAAPATQGPLARPAKVVRVEVGPYLARVTTAAGTRVRDPDPYLKDVHIWVRAVTPLTGGSIDLAGEQVRAGAWFTLDSRLWELFGEVESIRVG